MISELTLSSPKGAPRAPMNDAHGAPLGIRQYGNTRKRSAQQQKAAVGCGEQREPHHPQTDAVRASPHPTKDDQFMNEPPAKGTQNGGWKKYGTPVGLFLSFPCVAGNLEAP
jgi:hypothetical protein